MNFWTLLPVEWKKTRRSHLFWLLWIAPLLVVASGVANISAYFTPEYENAWAAMFIQSALLYAYYLLPLTMVVAAVMIDGKEKAHHGLRKLKSLPIDIHRTALAKFCVLIGYLWIEIWIFIGLFMVAGLLAVFSKTLSEALPLGTLLMWGLKLFVTIIPCTSIIWMIAVLFKTSILSIGLNFLLCIPGILFANLPIWIYYPYCYSGYLISCSLQAFSTGEVEAFPWMLFLEAGMIFIALSLIVSCLFYGRNAD